MENGLGPAWLSTWQAISDQEAQAKIRYKKFMEEWYRIETKMKLMDLRVDAMLRMRDEYLTHLFQKYPNWKPTFTSFGLRPSTQTPDYQSDLYRLMETEMIRSLRQRDSGGFRMEQPTFTQAMSGLPSYYHMPSHHTHMATPNYGFPTQSTSQSHRIDQSMFQNHFAMAPYHSNDGTSIVDPAAASQMAELKTEMAQIKSRLEDISLYLRELRHSAIELTTSVSRRSSMRDKERRRVPLGEQGGAKSMADQPQTASRVIGYERNLVRDDRKPDSFVDEVSKRLTQEKPERNVQVHYENEDEDDLESDISYHQKPAPVQQQQKAKPIKEVQVTKPARKKEIVEEDVSPEPKRAPSKGPRFNFGGGAEQKATENVKKPEPKPTPAPKPPPDRPSTDDDSDSPPATATWLISGEKPKPQPASVSAPVPVKEKPAQKSDQPDPAQKKPIESSPGSTPELAPKKPQATGSGYQALLGTMAKQKAAKKSTGSESDDMDDAFSSVVKSPSAPAAKDPPAPRPRDASLSDIFNFGKSEPAKNPLDDLLSPEKQKPKTAPAMTTTTAKPVASAESAPKKPSAAAAAAAAAEPGDFLKKLFPDKFPAAGAGGKGSSAPAGGARKKKPAFFMGDDSDDDDIDLPQGNHKSDLDDDFFFR